MFENIEERNKLVDKLVDRVTNDYNNFIDTLLLTRDIEQMAFRTTVLTWVKHNIIDNNGVIFRRIQERNAQGTKALYWVDRETVEILIASKINFIINVESSLDFKFDNLGRMFLYSETNISDILVSVLDRVVYHNKGWM